MDGNIDPLYMDGNAQFPPLPFNFNFCEFFPQLLHISKNGKFCKNPANENKQFVETKTLINNSYLIKHTQICPFGKSKFNLCEA